MEKLYTVSKNNTKMTVAQIMNSVLQNSDYIVTPTQKKKKKKQRMIVAYFYLVLTACPVVKVWHGTTISALPGNWLEMQLLSLPRDLRIRTPVEGVQQSVLTR